MIDLTWLAGPLGLVGLSIALVLWRRNRSGSIAEVPSAGLSGSAAFIPTQYPVIGGIAILLGALLWPSVALPTALAFIGGALLTMVVAAFVLKAVDDGGSAEPPKGEGYSQSAMAMALATGLTVPSVGLLGLGILYFVLVHAPAAFLPSELVDFSNIAGGLALGASVVVLLLCVIGGTYAGAAGAFPDSAAGDGAGQQRTHRTIRRLGAAGGAAASSVELLQSYLCASVTAIVIAGAGQIFPGHRLEAVALPILLGSIGLVCSLVPIASARLVRRSSPASALRTLGLVATALFLVLSYLGVVALGMEGQDPFTGREYMLSGPFWAVLAGSLSGVAIGFATEFYTSWRPTRRLAEGSGSGLGPTILRALALGMESVVIPVLLIGVATVAGFYFAGAYGIALAAVGMLATVAIVVGTVTFGPIAASWDVQANSSGKSATHSAGLGLSAIAESAEAIGRGSSVAAGGMTSLALLAGYIYATGLWGVGVDLQNPLLLVGLLVGAAVPVVVAAIVLGGGRRAASGAGGGQSSTSGKGPSHAIDLPFAGLRRKLALPLLIPIVLPPLLGYTLGVQSLAGLITGGVVSSLLLGLCLANSGSALVNTSIFVAANATSTEVHRLGRKARTSAELFAMAVSVMVIAVVKLIGVLSIVLIPWFIRIV